MQMTWGVLAAIAIILVGSAIPGIHLLATAPISPFIAGFVGGGIARADKGKAQIFGIIVAVVLGFPLIALTVAALILEDPILGLNDGLLIALSLAFIPYIWFATALGALLSYLMRRKSGEKAVS